VHQKRNAYEWWENKQRKPPAKPAAALMLICRIWGSICFSSSVLSLDAASSKLREQMFVRLRLTRRCCLATFFVKGSTIRGG
jgi:hypothetical protein